MKKKKVKVPVVKNKRVAVYRDNNGHFVSKEFALKHPKTTKKTFRKA